MTTRKITGLQFESMIRNGLANLQLMEERVNNLNVFPVADGDTGTNLCLTLESGIHSSPSNAELGTYLRDLSQGLLMGARGNSGVILSQFFKGVWQELSRCNTAGATELRSAFIRGYRVAYASMVEPVEGTMLTVFREGIDQIRGMIDRNTTIEDLFSMYLAELKHSLTLTTQRLPALKEAGVVDSGAMGFVILIEGMFKWLLGDIVQASPQQRTTGNSEVLSTEYFHENSIFEKGYCLEFILQLLKSSDYSQHFRSSRFVSELQDFGDSLAVVQDEHRVKVHIHTKKPAKVIQLAQEYGEFVTFKLENMQLQHNEHLHKRTAAQKEHKALAIICVANGPGTIQLFEDLGCDFVIDGGSTMNTSSREFLDAFSQVNADSIVVLPNHKNNIPAAEQAIKLFGRDNVHLLPTKSFAEGYFAVAMDVADSSDVDYRLSQMKDGISGVTTLSQTTASRDYTFHQISCRAGDEIVLNSDHLVCVSDNWCSALIQAMLQISDIDDKECCVIFRGSSASPDQQDELEDQLRENFPFLEPTFLEGGQDVYQWIIGIS